MTSRWLQEMEDEDRGVVPLSHFKSLLMRDSLSSLDLKTKMALCKDIHEYSLNGQIYNRLIKSC